MQSKDEQNKKLPVKRVSKPLTLQKVVTAISPKNSI